MPTNAFGQEIGPTLDDWAPPPPPPREPLAGRHCRLEPLEARRHAASLFAAYAAAPDARDWTYLPTERPDDAASLETLLAGQAASRDPLHFAVVEAGRAIGTLALMRIDRQNGVIEVGFINFSPALQRTAAASEALFLLMKLVFDDLGYRRLEWKCDALNVPSRRAALRFGFVYEGLFRQAVVTKGRNRDTAWYALVDRDWPRVRAAFEMWLDAGNFDEDGRQRCRLAAGAPATGAGA